MSLLLLLSLALQPGATDVSLPDWAQPSAYTSPTPRHHPGHGPETGPHAPGCGPSGMVPRKCDPAPVPIDGGLGLLALAGGAYAARRLRSRG